ncbi:MAG: glyoxalase superfamily protein [Pyrinomonadaceae bacterium]
MSQAESMVVRFETATPQFTVPDLVRTVEYYRDVLGFEIAGYWDGEQVSLEPANPPVFAIVRRDKVQLFFNRAENSEVRTGRAPGACDAFFQIVGVNALAAELQKRGAQIIDGPETQVYGQRELVVADCNGLILGFAESVNG